ncbi:MAG TPA: hypothetical protein VGG69_05015 [Rhizomicrobium sp.]
MRLTKLSIPAAAIACACAGTAMAAATQVNIADPKATTRAARVELGNRLAVQEVPPATFFHSGAILSNAGDCVVVVTAPARKSIVVRQVRVNVTDIVGGVTGGNNSVVLFFGSVCNEVVGEVNPGAVGLSTITFDPGLVLPAGGTLAATAFGSPRAHLGLDGYTVDSTVAPAIGP